MTKVILNNVADLTQPTTAATVINNNSDTIETAFDNTLSRDGTAPNAMGATIDMNSNRIINLPAPLTLAEPLRLTDANTLNGGGIIATVPAGGSTGDALVKSSNTDYAMQWVHDNALVLAGTNMVSTGTSPATLSVTNSPVFSGTVTSAGGFSGSLASGIIITDPVINGAVTGTAVSTSATPNTLVKRDAAGSAVVTSAISGYTTVATAGGTTTLTVSSTYNQYFTGASNQTVVLPVASTLTLGQSYRIVNISTGAITVQSSGLNTIHILPGTAVQSVQGVFTCILTSGTGVASWSVNTIPIIVVSGKFPSFNNSIAFGGTDSTTMTFPSTNATIARIDAANTFTGVQTLSSQPVLSSLTVSSAVATDGSKGLVSVTNTGSGNNVLTTSPTITTPNIVGTATNNNASAGSVGEYVESVIASGSAVALVSNTAKDVTTISLTAGDWDVDGVVVYTTDASTNYTKLFAYISDGSANTLDITAGRFQNIVTPASVPGAGFSPTCNVPPYRFSLASTTTIRLGAFATFSAGTMNAWGKISARRVR